MVLAVQVEGQVKLIHALLLAGTDTQLDLKVVMTVPMMILGA